MINSEELKVINDRLDKFEFQIELLKQRSPVNDYILESNITKKEFHEILDVMDKYRTLIDSGKKANKYSFETEILNIVKSINANYQFCIHLVQSFKEENRYEEIFEAFYPNK